VLASLVLAAIVTCPCAGDGGGPARLLRGRERQHRAIRLLPILFEPSSLDPARRPGRSAVFIRQRRRPVPVVPPSPFLTISAVSFPSSPPRILRI
jgi:hypothetical protein